VPDAATGNPTSVRDIAHYGAVIQHANVPAGTKYWKIVDAFHLSGAENKGNHNIFVEMLNADGSRRFGAHCTLYVGDKQFTNTVDKPANERSGTDFPIYRGPRYEVSGADMPSDRASGFSTDYPDEEAGNSSGHHSYMVVFQEALGGGLAGGSVRGTLANGAGRTVTLVGQNTNVSATAGADGSFSFDNVPPGTHNLAVADANVATSVVVSTGQTANISLTLPADNASMQQQLSQAVAEREKYKSALAQIKQIVQDAGL
jgi:hypothetical protein